MISLVFGPTDLNVLRDNVVKDQPVDDCFSLIELFLLEVAHLITRDHLAHHDSHLDGDATRP